MSPERILLYLVFASQIALVSYWQPAQLIARARGVLEDFPPASFPRLYVASTAEMDTTLRTYRLLNGIALAAGVGLLLADLALGGTLLAWNAGTAITFYLLLQFVPLMSCVPRPSFPYFSFRRPADPRPSRTAELRPRRLLDFVSPALLATASGVWLAVTTLILGVRPFDYPWFGGATANLLGLTFLYALFAVVAYRAIYGRKRDPFVSHGDHRRRIARTVTIALVSTIVWAAFIGLSILLQVLERPALIPVALSTIVQLAALVAFREFRVDDTDFDAYRDEPVGT